MTGEGEKPQNVEDHYITKEMGVLSGVPDRVWNAVLCPPAILRQRWHISKHDEIMIFFLK